MRSHLLLAVVVVLFVANADTAFARKQYMDAFKAKYPQVAANQKITCYLCHGKSKKVRNEYAKQLTEKLGKKNQKDKAVIDAALKELEAVASVVPGKTFGELFDAGAAPDGFMSIFDGKTLDGWDGDPKLWSVEDKTITGITTDKDPIPANTFLIWKKGKVADFEIEFEYKLSENAGNSGLQYRSFMLENKGKWAVGGYQADFDFNQKFAGILYGEKFRGILANRGQKTELIAGEKKPKVVGSVGNSDEIKAKIKAGDWNKYHVSAKGFHFVHKINGVVTCECTDKDEKVRRKDGILAFQLHRGPAMKLQVRNVRLKVLPDTSKAE